MRCTRFFPIRTNSSRPRHLSSCWQRSLFWFSVRANFRSTGCWPGPYRLERLKKNQWLETKALALLAFGLDAGEEAFHVVKRLAHAGFWLQDLAGVIHGVGDVADGFGHQGASGGGVAATLEFFRDLERPSVAAAKAGDDQIVCALEQSDQHRVIGRLFFKQLVNDEVGIADDRVHQADGG